jgi:hypothetical protein
MIPVRTRKRVSFPGVKVSLSILQDNDGYRRIALAERIMDDERVLKRTSAHVASPACLAES